MARSKAFLIAALLLALPALGAEGEDFLPFLFAAFAITWVAFFAYAFFITRKQADLKQEIESLRGLQSKDDDDDAA